MDAVRVPAALGVVGYHAFLSTQAYRAGDATTVLIGWLRHGGVFGVCLFFFLSGFGTHLAYLGRQGKPVVWTDFWRRRLRRLYPAYAAAIFIACGLNVAWPWLRGRPVWLNTPGGWDLASHFLLIHPWWPQTIFGIVPALWFVGVVAQMYLLYPLFLFFCRRWTETGAVLAVLGLTLAWRATAWRLTGGADAPGDAGWWMNAPARWFEWCLGAFLARRLTDGGRTPGWVGLPCLAGLLLWMSLGEPLRVIYEPLLVVLLGGCLWAAASATRQWVPGKAWTPLFLVAELSYAIYLLHQLFLYFVASAMASARLDDAGWWAAAFVSTCLVTFPVAWLLHRYVELPFAPDARPAGPAAG